MSLRLMSALGFLLSLTVVAHAYPVPSPEVGAGFASMGLVGAAIYMLKRNKKK